jgi:uncharacterized membrane protein
MALEQDNIAETQVTRAEAGDAAYQGARAGASSVGIHGSTDFQGGGKPRPYSRRLRQALRDRVGAGLAPALDVRTQQLVAWVILVLVMLVYAVVMSQEAVLRYDTFKATAFDLGNMDQVLWNTIHGRPFQFTNQAIDWYGPPTRLAVHFEPIILPLSLLYLFHADPRILLVFQTLALVSGAIPVFQLTRKYLSEWPLLAAVMAIAYLLSPALLGLNIFDFHPVSLATPLILYGVLALTYKRYIWFLVACILAASTKEDVPLAIAMLGILVIWRYKLPRLGTTLIIGGVLWSFLAFFVIIPHFYPGAQHNNFWYRYESLGDTPGTAVLNLLMHPWLIFSLFITFDRLFYVAGLLRSSGFLALLAPEWLLPALPGLAVNLLSTDPLLYSGLYQYNAVIIPFVMLAAIHGTRRLITIWQGWRGEETQTTNLVPYIHETSRAGASPAPTLRWLFEHLIIWKGFSRTGAIFAPTLQRLDPSLMTWWTRILSIVLMQWRRFSERMIPLACNVSVATLQQAVIVWILVMLVVNYVLILPSLNGFWADHLPGSREQHIQQLLDLIPPDASVSAGDNLNPHLSERQRLAVFPSPLNTSVQYIIVDLNDVFPENRAAVARELNQLVASGQFRELGRAEGVVLLVRRSGG